MFVTAHWLVETEVNSTAGSSEPAVDATVAVLNVEPNKVTAVDAVLMFASNEVVPLFNDTTTTSPTVLIAGRSMSEAKPEVP
jgi:hypothetical protein